MKLLLLSRPTNRGSALVMVLILSFVTLLILASTLEWTTTSANLSERNNEYYRTVAVAEAATEAVITRADSDYKKGGDNAVQNNIASYRSIYPTSAQNPLFGKYVFSDGQNQVDKTYVDVAAPAEYRNMTGKYKGLYGYSSIYRIISNAKNTESRFDITAAVRQDIELSTIPLFQFAIFYNLHLEIHPGQAMTVGGPVHGNQNIYVATSQPSSVTFSNDVTAGGNIINGKRPGDPQDYSPPGDVNFREEHDSGTGVLDLPVGTNNSPTGVRQILEVPPAGESLTSAIGKERFYNKADMIVIATNGGISVKSGPNSSVPNTVVPWAQASYFISTPSFYNKRENKTVNAVQIDVARLNTWNASNTVLRSALAQGDVTIIYVVDQRSQTSSTEPGIRLINGDTLPPRGLTVATPDPLYVKGHYNAPVAARGTHDTSGTKPAALIGDAITILSTNWNDSTSGTAVLGSRIAANTTINAAILAGIVETGGGYYSGGVENFPRFIENWNSKTLTYNGSMVVMFPSQFANAPFQAPGAGIGVYNAPTRNWAFDTNFRDPTKLPPGTPAIRVLIRSVWAMIKPNSIIVAAP